MSRLEQIVEPLLAWYEKNARDLPWRHGVTPYRVWISEIMLQQTRVEAVKGYFERFMQALPDVESLSSVEEKRLLKLWEGLGYYSRARNLKRAAALIMERYGGALPRSRDELLKLPGIGPYTAGAIASIAYGLAEPAVDGNVLRVLTRLEDDHSDIADAAVKRAAEKKLRAVIPQGRAGAFNSAMMELGATICGPNGPPECLCCPLRPLCIGYANGTAGDLPVKAAKKPRRIEERTVLVLTRDALLAVRRRPARGLLAGMWELPSVEGRLDDAKVIEAVRGFGLAPLRIAPLGDAKHIFTHVEWHMTGWRVTVEEPLEKEGLEWIDPRRLQSDYPLPSAFRAYLTLWEQL